MTNKQKAKSNAAAAGKGFYSFPGFAQLFAKMLKNKIGCVVNSDYFLQLCPHCSQHYLFSK
jgi:hypothetical protein